MTAAGEATTTAPREREGGQGLDHNQEESGNRAIYDLLASDDGRAWTDLVATCRVMADGCVYEAWALRGLVRWTRSFAEGGGYRYDVIEVVGENPLERQDPTALSTYEEEIAAGGSDDPQLAFVETDAVSYPYAYERVSQLFDSPNAPDLIVNPKTYTFGRQPGQHGALDVIQSRSPLIFSGPGMKAGVLSDSPARQVDIAPTIARAMGFPLIDGRDSSGRRSSERGVAPDVYFRRQDGAVIEDVFDGSGTTPERAFILLLDGQSHTELFWRLANEPSSIPNLRGLIASGIALRHGSITNFPSITWPSHNAIGTSCWSGHHDIVNPSYYLRATHETVSPQGQQFDTAKFLSHDVETLYEAFHRVYGSWDGDRGGALTASVNEPCTRGADHASLERQLVGDREWLRELTRETEHEISRRWADELAETNHHLIGLIDNRALGQARQLILDDAHAIPKFLFFEFSLPDGAAHDYGPHHAGAREALDETDVRIGRLLEALASRGALESTLFVITTDHGMATQDTTLLANPARIPERAGMAAITCEPCIYLRDLDVAVAVSHDGRTAQVSVLDNDADESGDRPAIAVAHIIVSDHRDGRVAEATTDEAGAAGFAIPMDLLPAELAMSVRAEGFNPRHLRLDGTNLALDLREVLYGRR